MLPATRIGRSRRRAAGAARRQRPAARNGIVDQQDANQDERMEVQPDRKVVVAKELVRVLARAEVVEGWERCRQANEAPGQEDDEEARDHDPGPMGLELSRRERQHDEGEDHVVVAVEGVGGHGDRERGPEHEVAHGP